MINKISTCLSPVKVYSESLHRFQYVPCGKCSACVVSKGLTRADKLDCALSEYKFRYFVTLTYQDSFLPLAKLSDGNYLVSDDVDYKGHPYSVSFDSLDSVSADFCSECFQKYGGVPVLSHKDLINFKKRLRKNIFKFTNCYERLFIHSVGEYGPLHCRPHFHLAIGFNNPALESIFEECVHLSWRLHHRDSERVLLQEFGRIDVQRIVGNGVSGYVSTYLNCVTYLPKVLGESCFRPFSSGSSKIDSFLSHSSNTDVGKFISTLPVKETRLCGKGDRVFSTIVSKAYQNRFFPKCLNFSRLSHYDRITLYRIFEEFIQFSARDFSTHILDYLESPFYVPTNTYVILSILCNHADKERAINSLIRCYYVSRKVFKLASSLGMSVDSYVCKIEEFYQKLEYEKLRNFLSQIESQRLDFLHPLSNDDMFLLYFDTSPRIANYHYYQIQFGVSSSVLVEDSPLYKNHLQKYSKILVDSTKIRKRNDDFDAQNKHRKIWTPILSKNKTKFLKSI